MRRILLIAVGLLGLIILILGGLLAYAVLNLNSIIQGRRDYILSRVSDAIGRPVSVQTIKASFGWGVLIDLNTVQVADDPGFSQLPLIQAQDIYLKVEFIPLLFRDVRITELNITHPVVSVIRDGEGDLNLAALARHRATHIEQLPSARAPLPNHAPSSIPNGNSLAPAPSRPNPAATVSIHKFTLTDGVINYLDRSAPGVSPVQFQNLQVTVANFSFGSRFDVDLSLAAFGDQKNFELSGAIGPLVTADGLDLNAIPVNLTAKAGPITLTQLQSVPMIAHEFPPPLTITGPLTATLTASGTVDAIGFTANTDLTANGVIWQPSFTKPSGTAMTLTATGTRHADRLVLTSADLAVASVKAHVTQIDLAAGHRGAHITTNNFDLAPVAALVTTAAKYHPTSGSATLDLDARLTAANHPSLDGRLILSSVNLAVPTAGGDVPVTQVGGPIEFYGNSGNTNLNFTIGSARALLNLKAQSLRPLRLKYQFNANNLILAELVPSRRNDGQDHGPEHLKNFVAYGTADIGSFSSLSVSGGTETLEAPGLQTQSPTSSQANPVFANSQAQAVTATVNVTTQSGLVDNVPFTNLAMAAGYTGDRVTINSLTLNSCDGAISANGVATLGGVPSFDLGLSASGLNLQKALTAVKAKAANTVRGILTGNLQISGHGKNFDRVRPTLRGNGKAQLTDAKLVGVNVAAQGLRKIDHLPGIGVLVPGNVIAGHPELFKSPDTDIQSAGLTFIIYGARLSTNDFFAQAIDYSATASGWFDLDKYLDMNSQIFLSQSFSSELIAARQNIAFLANRDGQIVIPLRITGRLPHPQVLPNIDILAQRAASSAVENKLGGLLNQGGRGLGGLFKHGNPLQGLFH
jgi:uncharacterized protein involved in outer membrane biogenesis